MSESVSVGLADPSLIGLLVQVVVLIVTGAWVVMSIRSKTSELGASIRGLTDAINKLDKAVDRLDHSVREIDRRVTRLEVLKENNKE